MIKICWKTICFKTYVARANQFFISNSMFKKNDKRRPTWCSHNAANEIDYILINNNLKSRVRNFNVLHKFEYDSDHHPIRLTISMKTKKKFKKFVPKLKFSIDNDKIKMKKFQDNLKRENFKNEVLDIELDYSDFIEKITRAAEPFKIKKIKIRHNLFRN